MPLRTATVIIAREGRDQGGVFTITEKPAIAATEWFLRAMQLLVRSGADVPPHIMQMGAAAFITMGVGTVLTGLGKAPWAEVKPLLDELLACVTSYQPPGGTVALADPRVIWPQVQEVATVLQLQEEVVSLHLNFSLRDRLSTYREIAAGMIAALTPNIETSTEPPQSSLAGGLQH